MFVIINADDSGLHPAVRRAVLDLSKKGTLSSTTLLANGPDIEQAAKMEGVGLGVHLNLLRGRPILPGNQIKTLVGADNMLLGDYKKLFARYVTGRLDHKQVEAEWSAQIERILDLGVKPTHFDSEKHIHAWPTLMAVAGRLADRYGVRWLRRPKECSELSRVDSGGIRVRFLNVCALFQKKPKKVSWPDMLWGIADQGENLSPQGFLKYMQQHAGERAGLVVEICCHPGLPETGDPEIPAEFGKMRVGLQWQAEFDALSNPEWLDVFDELGANVVNYGDLP